MAVPSIRDLTPPDDWSVFGGYVNLTYARKVDAVRVCRVLSPDDNRRQDRLATLVPPAMYDVRMVAVISDTGRLALADITATRENLRIALDDSVIPRYIGHAIAPDMQSETLFLQWCMMMGVTVPTFGRHYRTRVKIATRPRSTVPIFVTSPQIRDMRTARRQPYLIPSCNTRRAPVSSINMHTGAQTYAFNIAEWPWLAADAFNERFPLTLDEAAEIILDMIAAV